MGSKQEAFTEAVNRICPELLPTLGLIVRQLEAGTAQRLGVGGCQGCADSLMEDAAAAIKKLVSARGDHGQWRPGDLRCDDCDNGVEQAWLFCAWCGVSSNWVPRAHIKVGDDNG